MVVTPKDFTKRERDILIFCLNRRMDSLEERNRNFLSNSKSWKNEFYYPFLTSKLKLEDNKKKLLSNSEKFAIVGCINEEITNKQNEVKVNKEILEELLIMKLKIEN